MSPPNTSMILPKFVKGCSPRIATSFRPHLRTSAPLSLIQAGLPRFYSNGQNKSDEDKDKGLSAADRAFETFSWLRPCDSKRLDKVPYLAMVAPIFRYRPIYKFMCSMTRSSTKAELQRQTTDQYFPREFMDGAKLAFVTLCNQLSSNNTFMLRRCLSQDLYERFDTELEELEGMDLSIKIEPLKLYGAKLKDVWFDYGPSEAFDINTPLEKRMENYYYTLAFCIRTAYPKDASITDTPGAGNKTGSAAGLEGNLPSITNQFKKGYNAMLSGIQSKVDVEIDAEMRYTVTESGKVVEKEEGRQTIVMRLKTPYYSPSSDLSQAYLKKEDEAIPGLRPGDVVPVTDIDPPFEWRISDIDYMLFNEEVSEFANIVKNR